MNLYENLEFNLDESIQKGVASFTVDYDSSQAGEINKWLEDHSGEVSASMKRNGSKLRTATIKISNKPKKVVVEPKVEPKVEPEVVPEVSPKADTFANGVEPLEFDVHGDNLT